MIIQKISKNNMAALKEHLVRRSPSAFPEQEAAVRSILEDVRENGDEALIRYAAKFDCAVLTAATLRVSEEEIEEAVSSLDPEFLSVMERAAGRIRSFHEHQKETGWTVTDELGCRLGQKVTPLDIAGIYVPGGKASYPSSVLMNAVPASVAGVGRIVMCSPCGKDGKIQAATLAAAKIAGVTDIYKAGGAQAVAAMAYGTETVPKTDKVTGPGNIYVALAKKAVFGQVSIDSIAGPSEILVLCDEDTRADYAAADLLSQAEHDEMASPILISTSEKKAEEILAEVEKQLAVLPRKEIAAKALEDYGAFLVASTMEEAVEAVNMIASEHLEILTKDPRSILPSIRHAGAIFLGEYASEPLGDYFAGPNHILPTCGTARFFSALSVRDFIKYSSVIDFTREGLASLHRDIETFAEAEGLHAHAASVGIRFKEEMP